MTRQPKLHYRQGGFTLIELMMVIVIVAILLAVALPAYQNQVIRGHRAAAKAQMLEIANREQQFLLANRAYADKATLETNGYSLPADVATRYGYDVEVGVDTVPYFLIRFTPIPTGAQAGDGELTLDSQGTKGGGAEKWAR